MHVWFVDDRAENRATWYASFPPAVREACQLRAFATVPEVLAALEAGDTPDVVFVDFFIDGHYGFEVIERFVSGSEPPPLLIAHSSMQEANLGMVRLGAHLALEKVKGAAKTRSIADAIRSVEDLRRLVDMHRDGTDTPPDGQASTEPG